MATRGRPRSFDRSVALQAMMNVFWAKGYEGAQLVDLTAAAGIGPPSFYAAFGSKEAAFCEAVDHYIVTVGAPPMQVLEQAGKVQEGLRAMLLGSVDVALSTHPGGCMLVLGVVNCLPENEGALRYLQQTRIKTVDLISARLERAKAEGELNDTASIPQLARFFHGIMQAISFQAREGASRQQLADLIEPALAILPLSLARAAMR